jgi:hypothetical protein
MEEITITTEEIPRSFPSLIPTGRTGEALLPEEWPEPGQVESLTEYDEYDVWKTHLEEYGEEPDTYTLMDNVDVMRDNVHDKTKDAMYLISQHEPWYWLAIGKNMSWRHLSGYKWIECKDYSNTGRDLLDGILPNTDCTYKLSTCIINFHGNPRGALFMTNSHHDAPRGEEYLIIPLTAEEWDPEQ